MIDIFCFFFFFNDTATTEIYTLSLHDALPISRDRPQPPRVRRRPIHGRADRLAVPADPGRDPDRKSTRLNSSHANISYAVFCLKKKKTTNTNRSISHMIDITRSTTSPDNTYYF